MTKSDFSWPSDAFRTRSKPEQLAKDRLKLDKLTKNLEKNGVVWEDINSIINKLEQKANGPIDPSDWMTMDSGRFQPTTCEQLSEMRLTRDGVLSDSYKAENFVAEVLKLEGIPTGNGDTEPLRDVVGGFYDTHGHGIDLIGVDKEGKPFPIEVKKYHQSSGAALSDYSITDLEPATQRWKTQREARAQRYNEDRFEEDRPDANETWKPEVKAWHDQVAKDVQAISRNQGDLPVTQMDDLWAQDRWLKLLASPEKQDQLHRAGVLQRFRDLNTLQSSPWLPEWQELLQRRTVVVVSDGQGGIGKKLYNQVLYGRRSQSVIKIQV